MYSITWHLESLVRRVERGHLDLDTLVVIEEAPDFPGELLFQPATRRDLFYSRYRDWLSPYLVLNELHALRTLIDQLCEDGFEPVFGPSCEPILDAMAHDWNLPLEIEGYDLHRFQQFGMRRAFGQPFWFWNWSTGAGKSFCSAAGAKHLFAQGEIDLVIAATVSKSKLDLCWFFAQAGLDAVVNDGARPKRRTVYADHHQVYVMNYEKLWVDFTELAELVDGARVLFVFDECHRIVCSGLNNSTPNKARTAFEQLQSRCQARVWPMSASVVNGDPLRYRDVYGLSGGPNPLGSQRSFLDRYADEVKTIDILRPKTGRTFPLTVVDWNTHTLTEVRHRVGSYTQAVRKTDPGVREYFKGMQTLIEPVQMSPQERHLTDFIVDRAWEVWKDAEGAAVNLGPYYSLLRYLCNVPQALLHTEHQVGQELVAEIRELVVAAESTKLAKLNEQLESIRESGDKALVFTAFTTLTLHLIKDRIEVPHVVHWGVGQSERESQRVKEAFQSDADITCFLTSDAGSHGLNMQCARYVISYEPTYSYDLAMQRFSRIDRADSHLDGLTGYTYVTEDSVEQRVMEIQTMRRRITEVVQGTSEALSPRDRERALGGEAANLAWLIFGDRI